MADMTIEQIRQEKRRVEEELDIVITKAVRDFQERSGVLVTGVNVGLSEVTAFGVRQGRYSEVGRVEISIEL